LWSRKLVEFTGLPGIRAVLSSRGRPQRDHGQQMAGPAEDQHGLAGRWHHYEPYIGPLRRLLELPP